MAEKKIAETVEEIRAILSEPNPSVEELNAKLDEMLDYINGPCCFIVDHPKALGVRYTHEVVPTVESVAPGGKIVAARQANIVGALRLYWELRAKREVAERSSKKRASTRASADT